MQLKSMGADAPVVTNELGGKQHDVPYAFVEMDPHAMFAMAEILDYGLKKYGAGNWRNITVKEHLNHALIHIYAHLAGDDQDDHLIHLMCRSMFAAALVLDAQSTRAVSTDVSADNSTDVDLEQVRAHAREVEERIVQSTYDANKNKEDY